MPLSKEIIDQAIQGIKQTPKPWMVAQPFQNFAPVKFSQPNVVDPSQFIAGMSAAGQGATTSHEAFTTQIANKQARDLVAKQREQVQKLQGQLRSGGEGAVRQQTPNQSRTTATARDREFGKWGTIPEVSDIDTLRPNAPIKTMNWRGHNFQVNQQVAPIFKAFLNNLWRTGYKPAVIGGYSNRNIAGTDTRSLHSYGLAIDIDPAENPVQQAGQHMQTSLPPHVGALAAKYGLAWGGSWNSYKDPMHFSVPWGGRE